MYSQYVYISVLLCYCTSTVVEVVHSVQSVYVSISVCNKMDDVHVHVF